LHILLHIIATITHTMVRPSRSSPRKRAAHRRLYLVFSVLSFFPTIVSDIIFYISIRQNPGFFFKSFLFFHYYLRRSVWLCILFGLYCITKFKFNTCLTIYYSMSHREQIAKLFLNSAFFKSVRSECTFS
jgi:uncharacterized membrane protein